LFDKYRDDPKGAPDEIGMDGTMQYLDALGVSVEDIGMLVVSELVKSPSMGEIKREGFVNGWKEQG
jgi:DCN1-like protein 1/2